MFCFRTACWDAAPSRNHGWEIWQLGFVRQSHWEWRESAWICVDPSVLRKPGIDWARWACAQVALATSSQWFLIFFAEQNFANHQLSNLLPSGKLTQTWKPTICRSSPSESRAWLTQSRAILREYWTAAVGRWGWIPVWWLMIIGLFFLLWTD